MAPADKKYWDSVAGENLRLYRMIQVGIYSIYSIYAISTSYILYLNRIYTVSNHYLYIVFTQYQYSITVYTISTYCLHITYIQYLHYRYIYTISGEQRGRTAVTTTTLVTTTRGGAGVISLLFPWELFSPKLSP